MALVYRVGMPMPSRASVATSSSTSTRIPTTGFPAEVFAGLPTQDVGLEFFVDLF